MARSIPYTSVVLDRLNDSEVQFWAKELQVETDALRDAIRVVGPRLTHLRRYFGKSARVIPLDNWRGPKALSRYGVSA